MRKFISVGMAAIATIILILVLVFTSIGLVINDETFITNEFTELAISQKMGISNSDLVLAMTRLVDYMEGDADDINVEVTVNNEKVQMFDYPQEAEHMVDVRQIYMTIASYRDIGVLVMLILYLFAAVVHFRMAPQYLAQGYLSGAFVMLLISGFLGTWASLDFSNFWTFFHEALFWNDLWLFDGTQSRMINMLPEDIFADIIARVALYAGAVVLVLIVISIFALILTSAGHKRRRAIALARQKAHDDAVALRKKARADAKAAAEKEKRLAQKRAQATAIKMKKVAQAEAEQREAERERKQQEKREAKRVDEEAAIQAAREAKRAERKQAKLAAQQEAEQEPAPQRTPASRREDVPREERAGKSASSGAARGKKKKSNIDDDTGFFDD